MGRKVNGRFIIVVEDAPAKLMGIYVRDCSILKYLEAISKVSLLLWNNIGAVYPRAFVNLSYNYERYSFSL